MSSISQISNVIPASERFLRGPQTTPKTAKDDLRRHLSFGTDAISHILVAAKCPERFRSYIDCLVGLSDGKHEFEASDNEIAARVRPEADEKLLSKGATRQWVKRAYRDFEKWQVEHGFSFVECRRGYIERHTDHEGKEIVIYHKSRYRLHILTYAERVVAEARRNPPAWAEDPLRAIEQAARAEVQRLSGNSGLGSPGRPSNGMPWYVEIKSYLKTAQTFLDKTTQAIPEGEELYGQYVGLVRNIHEQASKLVKKLQ
jgi:hypothetical protein